jgi:NAD(P)-dependent dehydrogenase (short-subunit alcohol dehydrogenase family)
MARQRMSGVIDRSFVWTHRPARELELGGKTIAIVGGTDGLGRAIARLAASRGAKVIVVGRTFRDEGMRGIEFVKADLSRMREAKEVARAIPAETLDVLLLTTGIFAAPKRQVTDEGLERDMAVSYLSRLALLRELVPCLGRDRGPRPRVFVMGYPGTNQVAKHLDDLNAERSYHAMTVHMTTVAGNEALVLDGARRQADIGFFGLNPGLIKTAIRSNFLGEGSLKHRLTEALIGLFTMSAETYAERTLPLLFAPELEGKSGLVFDQKARAILPSEALTEPHVTRLLEESTKLVDRAQSATITQS